MPIRSKNLYKDKALHKLSASSNKYVRGINTSLTGAIHGQSPFLKGEKISYSENTNLYLYYRTG